MHLIKFIAKVNANKLLSTTSLPSTVGKCIFTVKITIVGNKKKHFKLSCGVKESCTTTPNVLFRTKDIV